MKKLFTLVCGVLFAMFANAATLDIGEPNNNVKDGETVWYDATTKIFHSTKIGAIAQDGGLAVRIALITMISC